MPNAHHLGQQGIIQAASGKDQRHRNPVLVVAGGEEPFFEGGGLGNELRHRFPLRFGSQVDPVLDYRNGAVGGDHDNDQVLVLGGKPESRIEPGAPGAVFAGNASSVQQAGKPVQVDVQADVEGSVHLGKRFCKLQHLVVLEVNRLPELLAGDVDRIFIQIDHDRCPVPLFAGPRNDAGSNLVKLGPVRQLQKEFFELHQVGFAIGGQETSVGKAADLLARKSQEPVAAAVFGGYAAVGQIAARHAYDVPSVRYQPVPGILDCEQKFSGVLEVGKFEPFRVGKTHQERCFRNHGLIDERQGPARPGAFLSRFGNPEHRVEDGIDFHAAVEAELHVELVADVVANGMGGVFAKDVLGISRVEPVFVGVIVREQAHCVFEPPFGGADRTHRRVVLGEPHLVENRSSSSAPGDQTGHIEILFRKDLSEKPHVPEVREVFAPLVRSQVEPFEHRLVAFEQLLRIVDADGIVGFLDVNKRRAAGTGKMRKTVTKAVVNMEDALELG